MARQYGIITLIGAFLAVLMLAGVAPIIHDTFAHAATVLPLGLGR